MPAHVLRLQAESSGVRVRTDSITRSNRPRPGRDTGHVRFQILIAATLLAALATACSPAAVPFSSTPQACPAALLGPVTLLLAEDGVSTVGLPEGAVAVPLRWPDGYGLMPGPGGAEVVNERGDAVARIGERVFLGGGFAADDAEFQVCGDVMREAPEG